MPFARRNLTRVGATAATAGVLNSFAIDPLAGLGKMAVFTQEHNLNAIILNTIHAEQTGGLEAVWNYGLHLTADVWNDLVVDPQVQSAAFLLALLAIATIPVVGIPIASGITLGTTVKGLIDLDAVLANFPTKESVIQFISSPQVRTTIAGSFLVFSFVALGAGRAAQFDAFRNGLSPEAQASLSELSLLEQSRIYETAKGMNVSPEALDFYLEHSGAGDARLANLSVNDALRVSNLAEQSGEAGFVLDYVTRYGATEALKNASPDGLRFYLDQAKVPGSRLSRLTTQEGVTLSALSPDSIAKVTGLKTPTLPKGVVPDVKTPVLNLTPQEIHVLSKISTQNPNAEYAVLGLWKGGQGYTMVGSEGYTFLNMPESIYEFFEDYPGDFRQTHRWIRAC